MVKGVLATVPLTSILVFLFFSFLNFFIIHNLLLSPFGTGNGGSTLVALEFLNNLYGEKIFQMKILLIHAGGWSQRMPNATILGKIFSAVPHGQPIYQMLDLKLALYWPFVSIIAPGIFLVCADDILVYDLGEENDWSVPARGFTALAHPSPISIGRTHGVYVIDEVEKLDTKKHVLVANCLEVLQKPSDEKMKERGALLKSDDNHFEFADGICMDGDIVYTDSSYYFGVDVMRKLLKLKQTLGSISCEIDAYGDFLQALGQRSSDAYIFNTSNISQMTSELIQVRKQAFDALQKTNLSLIIMNASRFIHIGTTKELIHHFCQDKDFQYQLALEKNVFNCWGENLETEKKHIPDSHSEVALPAGSLSKGCVMHSVLPRSSSVAENCIVEYCHFDIPVVFRDGSIISNCQWLKCDGQCQETLVVPENIFLHTVSVLLEGASYFVTIFFAISDNLKTSVPQSKLASLPFLHKTVGFALQQWQLPERVVIPEVSKVSDDHSEVKRSLWTLKLYPGATSMTESLQMALEMIQCVHEECKLTFSLVSSRQQFFSLADALAQKDVMAMLNFRRQVFHKIQAVINPADNS